MRYPTSLVGGERHDNIPAFRQNSNGTSAVADKNVPC